MATSLLCLTIDFYVIEKVPLPHFFFVSVHLSCSLIRHFLLLFPSFVAFFYVSYLLTTFFCDASIPLQFHFRAVLLCSFVSYLLPRDDIMILPPLHSFLLPLGFSPLPILRYELLHPIQSCSCSLLSFPFFSPLFFLSYPSLPYLTYPITSFPAIVVSYFQSFLLQVSLSMTQLFLVYGIQLLLTYDIHPFNVPASDK